MSDQALNAALAVLLGAGLAVALLLPTAAVQYRRDGRLGPSDLGTLVAASVYWCALWTYTLLPLPEPGRYTCTIAQTEPFATLREIPRALDATLLHDPAFLQAALNLVLFVPLGWFVRMVLRRGVVVATVVGLGMSLFIECTQRTGLWGLYDCSYRLFDVDDLIVNTAGATVGSLLSLVLVPWQRRRTGTPRPANMTTGRRLVAMACDLLFVTLLGAGLATGWRAWQLWVLDGDRLAVADSSTLVPQVLVPLAIEAGCVLLAGRTVGEWTVAARTRPADGTGAPRQVVRRTVKLVTGVGGFTVLPGIDSPWSGALLLAWVVVTVAAVFVTSDRRGLSNALAGLRLVVDRDEE